MLCNDWSKFQKMNSSFTAVFLLGLLALGHATPLTTVTQIPRTDEDLFREAVTDGFLVDQDFLTAETTPPPREETTPLSVETTTTADPLSNMIEGGSGDEDKETTTAATATTPEMTTLPFTPTHNEFTSSHIEVPGPSLFPEEEGSGTEEPQTTTTTILIIPIIKDVEANVRMRPSDLATTTTMTPMTAYQAEIVGQEATEMPKGHVTPDWVIIVGFLIGVAVLVLLCVAVATRDKWNGPNQFNQTGVTDQLVEEEKALEMETFLHNEPPKENGKAEEYTVIPLEELPHSYSS